MEQSSSAMGYIISLGEAFVKDSHDEMDNNILPKVKQILGEKVPPRVRTCYGMLMWFVLKVLYKIHTVYCRSRKIHGWKFSHGNLHMKIVHCKIFLSS